MCERHYVLIFLFAILFGPRLVYFQSNFFCLQVEIFKFCFHTILFLCLTCVPYCVHHFHVSLARTELGDNRHPCFSLEMTSERLEIVNLLLLYFTIPISVAISQPYHLIQCDKTFCIYFCEWKMTMKCCAVNEIVHLKQV
jgi:hypothetical protein